ncbi:MAG: hypothetical protein BWY89_01975 [Bacteroidetes bacterium ADurb.BinA012]|nr:MAG: hypothetical protein BWY89_01975 [Bacteroidetes bacterium ADurb.BinA012]
MTTRIIVVFDVMFYKGFMQSQASLPHKTICLLSALANKKVINLLVYFRIIQEVCERRFRIYIPCTQDAETGKQVKRTKTDKHTVPASH